MAATDKRLRVSFDAETEAIRRAIHVAASMKGVGHGDILNSLIKDHLGKYIALAEQELAEEEEGSRPKRRRAEP